MDRVSRRKLLFQGAAGALATGIGPAAAAEASDHAALRIARIEENLRPRIVIKGRARAPTSMTARMAHYTVPGVSLAFFDDQGLVWTRQYGLADVGAKRPVTASTLFQASSISKMTTAVGVLRLVREGVLGLDEDVNLKLRRWKIPENEFTRAEKVTVRRLLSHSAGTTVHGTPGYARGGPLPTTTQILNGEPPANSPRVEVDAVPGSAYRYSGGGYVVLQQLVEDVTGRQFAAVMRELVLAPAGMSQSTYAQPLPDDRAAGAAVGHAADGSPIPGGAAVFPEAAPAGLWSTPSDLARFGIELNRAVEGRSDRLLDPALAREMMRRQEGGWGLGVALGSEGEERQFGHVGTNPGYQSYLIFLPERKQGFAVMTNGANQSGFFLEIAMAVAAEYGWSGFKQVERETVSVDPAVLRRYRGTWLADGAPPFDVKLEGDRLVVVGGPFGPVPVELHAQSAFAFFILSTGFTFDFSDAEQGRAVLGGGIRAVRSADAPE